MVKTKNKNKSGNKVVNYFKNNKSQLIYLVVGIIVGILIMVLFWPDRIAELKNGEQVILEIDGKKFTADDLYSELKVSNGNETLFNMVDLAILYQKYPKLDKDAESYASEQSQTIYSTYESYYGYSKEEFLSGNGFEEEKDFLQYLKEQFYYQTYYDEYVTSTITDKEIDTFYKDHVFGEASVYVFSSTDEDNDLEAVRKSLKSGKSFNDIKEKYTKINSYAFDSVTFKDTDTLSQTILDMIAATSKAKYSKIFTDDVYGNVVVYVVDKKEKDKLDNVKKDITSMIVTDKQQSDANLYYQAFIKLRKEYNLNIYDTEIKKLYDATVKQYK